MRKPRRQNNTGKLLLVVLIVGALVAIGVYSVYFPSGRTSNPSLRAEINGIRCQQNEQLAYHWHTAIELYDNGKAVKIPANIGIFPDCLYWLHTHDDSGTIHVESPLQQTYTLRDFMAIWDVKITESEFLGKPVTPETPIRVFVNGQTYQGDPGDIPLRDKELIVIQYGKSPS